MKIVNITRLSISPKFINHPNNHIKGILFEVNQLILSSYGKMKRQE